MKHGNNNGIDALLRNVGRKRRTASAGSIRESDDSAASLHLDSDELNAYAEGTLPVATRSRYTAHVADCSQCRNTITQLILAAGVKPQPIDQPLGATLWLKLREFFSPQVLRYAIPAFAFLAVIAVGVVVMRQQNRSAFVAQNEQARQKSPEVTASGRIADDNNSALVAPKPPAPQTSGSPTQRATSSPTQRDGKATSADADQKAGSADTVSVAKESPRTVAQASPKSAKEATRDQPTFAPAPAAAPPPAPKEKL